AFHEDPMVVPRLDPEPEHHWNCADAHFVTREQGTTEGGTSEDEPKPPTFADAKPCAVRASQQAHCGERRVESELRVRPQRRTKREHQGRQDAAREVPPMRAAKRNAR